MYTHQTRTSKRGFSSASSSFSVLFTDVFCTEDVIGDGMTGGTFVAAVRGGAAADFGAAERVRVGCGGASTGGSECGAVVSSSARRASASPAVSPVNSGRSSLRVSRALRRRKEIIVYAALRIPRV